MARWWNGHDFDVVYKDADTKKQLLGALKLLIDEVRPYQIAITDSTQKPKLGEEKIKEIKEMERRVIERITEPERWEE